MYKVCQYHVNICYLNMFQFNIYWCFMMTKRSRKLTWYMPSWHFQNYLQWQSENSSHSTSKAPGACSRADVPCTWKNLWLVLFDVGRKGRIFHTVGSNDCKLEVWSMIICSIIFQRLVLNTLSWKDLGTMSIIQSTITPSSTHDHYWKTPHLSPVYLKGRSGVSMKKFTEILCPIEEMWANISSHLVRSVQTIPNMPNAQKRHWQAVHAARLVHQHCFPSGFTNYWPLMIKNTRWTVDIRSRNSTWRLNILWIWYNLKILEGFLK